MKERPILFNGPMVQATLDDRKTMTRRVVKEPGWATPHTLEIFNGMPWASDPFRGDREVPCPYGVPGDRLWVREAFRGPYAYEVNKYPLAEWGNKPVWYCADGNPPEKFERQFWPKSRPSIHMPRRFSRITLEITEVRVERLQDISEADAIAEGCTYKLAEEAPALDQARTEFRELWASLHGTGSWDANPLVWVVGFKKAAGEAG